MSEERDHLLGWGAHKNGNQPAREGPAGALQPAGHGLFTYFLLEGLKGAADADGDKHVSLGELHEYARAAVAREARRANRDQTPQLRTASPELRLY